jgi:hypothetical protein
LEALQVSLPPPKDPYSIRKLIMSNDRLAAILTKERLARIFPPDRTNAFFDALFGDADEGAYDIELVYRETRGNTMIIDMELHQRPGRCLACNLTQGLPQVFTRHPIINVKGIVEEVGKLLGNATKCTSWSLGYTEQHNSALHTIPIKISIE